MVEGSVNEVARAMMLPKSCAFFVPPPQFNRDILLSLLSGEVAQASGRRAYYYSGAMVAEEKV